MRTRRYVLRQALASASAVLLAGCDALSKSAWFPKVLGVGEQLSSSAQHLLTSRRSMAQEFTEADLSPRFRSNGTANPANPEYQALAAHAFADWKLVVDSLVQAPSAFTLAELRAMPSRSQITRHDCVEGWSAIGKCIGDKGVVPTPRRPPHLLQLQEAPDRGDHRSRPPLFTPCARRPRCGISENVQTS
jgi:DMSO/TMAO reductase YedYZ molybdopterin-dependent catalytic subunit